MTESQGWKAQTHEFSGYWISADGGVRADIEAGNLHFAHSAEWNDLHSQSFLLRENEALSTEKGKYRLTLATVVFGEGQEIDKLVVSFTSGKPLYLEDSIDLFRVEDTPPDTLAPFPGEPYPPKIREILDRIPKIRVGESPSEVFRALGIDEDQLEWDYQPLGMGTAALTCDLDKDGKWLLQYETWTVPWKRAKDDRFLLELQVRCRSWSGVGANRRGSTKTVYPWYDARPYESAGLIVTSRTGAHRADRLEYRVDLSKLRSDMEKEFSVRFPDRDLKKMDSLYSMFVGIGNELRSGGDRSDDSPFFQKGRLDYEKILSRALPIAAKHCRVGSDDLEVHAILVNQANRRGKN